MSWRQEWKPLLVILACFLAIFHLPVGIPRFDKAVGEGLALVRWYAREHVVLCLIPAFFIAGAIGVFVSQAAVMRYLGPRAGKAMAYAVASVSGSVLAVCSCTILPLFAGIHRMGAGLGPATAFLYAGPAVNVLAIILTARILGPSLGVARAVGAIVFSVIIGLVMHWLFRNEEQERLAAQPVLPESGTGRSLYQTALTFACLVAILIFSTWSGSSAHSGAGQAIHAVKWWLSGASALGLCLLLAAWYGLRWPRLLPVAGVTLLLIILDLGEPLLPFGVAALGFAVVLGREEGELGEWVEAAWEFAKQILPLLLIGVLVAGILLGRPGHEGLIPARWVAELVGGNSLGANLVASVAGAFMYFATLTEVPILQGLLGAGMGQGPALALLLAGPALSLPSVLVLGSILGARKTAAFIVLVVIMATLSGWIYGNLIA